MGWFSLWSSAGSDAQPSTNSNTSGDACPVDHNTRSIWLQQQQRQSSQPSLPKDHPKLSPGANFASSPTAACSSDVISQNTTPVLQSIGSNLSQDRTISSIPRAFPSPTASPSSANAETATAETSHSGNWIYPSEAQFFQAVLRKNHNTENTSPENLAETVSSIIPIHNSVNERAWRQIREWESKYSTPFSDYPNDNPRSCPPKLLSFRGLGAGPEHDVETPSGVILSYLSLFNPRTPLTPQARYNAFVGYQKPFDRHDWVVERCGGEKIEYVIDFYQGKDNGMTRPGGQRNLNFYLDVRPKLNSVEGARMRWRKTFEPPPPLPTNGK